MYFEHIIGQQHIVKNLEKSAENGRIPHAQLFVGKEGVGVLQVALAYATMLLCKNHSHPEHCFKNCKTLQHPDLHFAFPTAITDKVKEKPVSNDFISEWRTFLTEQPYGSLFDWYQHIGIENKQGKIGDDEAKEIVKALQLKPYEGGYQIMIIWMPEKMNDTASNKLLKLIEEPPYKTIFLLVSVDDELIINTIKSRCQTLYFGNLSTEQIAKGLIGLEKIDENTAKKIAFQSDGSLNRALQLLQGNTNEMQFEKWFIDWVRSAFRAKGNAGVINQLITWSNEIATLGRESQKQFLLYCLQVFRQALLYNYGAKELVFFQPLTEGFSLEKFSPYIHNGNINEIVKELENAIYHIERNGSAKMILLDMSIKLTRLIHAKEVN